MGRDINHQIADMIDDAEKRGISRAVIAEALDLGITYFNKMYNINDPAQFKVSHILQLTIFLKDSRVIEHLVRESWNDLGLVLVKQHPPKVMRSGDDLKKHRDLVEQYALDLQRWKAGQVSDSEIIKLIDKISGELYAARTSIKKKNAQQGLDFSAKEKR